MKVTIFYLTPLVFLFVALSWNIIRLRYKHQVSIGSNKILELERAIRAHGNFAEYVPLTLLSLGLLEYSRAPLLLVHFLGGFLLLGRITHAYCFTVTYHIRLRQFGILATFTALITSAATAYYLAF